MKYCAQRRPVSIRLAVVIAALSFYAAGALGDELPRVWGNTQIARDVMAGNANMLLVGDSLQGHAQKNAYLTRWRPESFGGITLSTAFSSLDLFGGTAGPWMGDHDWLANMTLRAPHAPAADDGLTGVSPGVSVHWVFDDVTAPGDGRNLLGNRLLSSRMSAYRDDVHFGQPWIAEDGDRLTVDALIYANPNGLSSGVMMEAWQGSDYYASPIAAVPVDAYAATASVQKVSITLEPGQWDPQQDLVVQFRMASGETPTESSNLVFLGMRYHTPTGLSLTNIAQGGQGVDYFLDPANCTDENLSGFLTAAETDVAYIWLGQNDGRDHTPAQWQEAIEELLDRYKAAKADMRFILISSYDTGSETRARQAEALYEISDRRDDALFLDLYQAAGGVDFLNANYLSDGVHQNADGAAYFADQIWGLLDEAARTRWAGDFDGDGDVDADDIDDLRVNLRGEGVPVGDAKYDLDGDGDADMADMDVLIHDLVETSIGVGTEYGDLNLDGIIDTTDWTIFSTFFAEGNNWAQGNANWDDVIDTTDLTILATYSGFGALDSTIPEPASAALLAAGALAVLRRRRGG